jgi:hypothetical protein
MSKILLRYTYGGFKFEWDGETVMVRISDTNQTHSLFFLDREDMQKDDGTFDTESWRALGRSWVTWNRKARR